MVYFGVHPSITPQINPDFYAPTQTTPSKLGNYRFHPLPSPPHPGGERR
jgi:hypothetical protein